MTMLDHEELTEEAFLAQYQAEDFERPSVAVDMVVFTVAAAEEENYRKLPEKKLKLLLIRRGIHPDLGKWALPGGFVRSTETTEQAAVRELQEETGLDNIYLEQLYTFSEPKRDPRTRVISCAYLALIDSDKVSIEAGDDAAEAAWFTLRYRLLREQKELNAEGFVKTRQYELQLTNEQIILTATVAQTMTVSERPTETSYRVFANGGLAFDHAKMITYAMERLRGKLDYTDIALNLMPKLFTLTELQQVHEVILGKELLKAAFRRKIAPLVSETDHYTENAGHRPSRLYRRNRRESSDL